MGRLILALPSKGRLMEQTDAHFEAAGVRLAKTGSQRGYRGEITGMPDIEVNYVSSSEIAQLLRDGSVHLGITGEDLVRETVPDADQRLRFVKKLGFGFADVVVAAPACWLDVRRMSDLEDTATAFYRAHGTRMRVATKYANLTRRFFSEHGVSTSRTVESLGATEGAPAAGLAEIIVDITTTGSTIRANALRVLDDGVMLKSEANLIEARAAGWTDRARAAADGLLARLATLDLK